MCGIFGIIGAADKELGECIAQCIHHRDPHFIKAVARYSIAAVQKIGLISNPSIAGDIHWVGKRLSG